MPSSQKLQIIGSDVNLCPAVAPILNFRQAEKNRNFVEDLPMIILGSLVSIIQVVSEKKRFETFFP
jgi:hypothetical protein